LKTELPNLAPYALKSELPVVPSLTPYALKTDLTPLALKSELPNLAPYALKSELPDLTPYAKTADVAATYATKATVLALADRVIANEARLAKLPSLIYNIAGVVLTLPVSLSIAVGRY